MAYNARSFFVSDGTTPTFAINFPYMEASDIYVYANGSLYSGTVSFDAPNVGRLSPVPAAGTNMEVRRQTRDAAAIAEIQAGTFSEQDMNANSLQYVYLNQEREDADLVLQNLVASLVTEIGTLQGIISGLQTQVLATTYGGWPIGVATSVSLITIPVGVALITTSGYSTPGDLGAASYKRVNSLPSHPGYVQDHSGAYFELIGPELRVECWGTLDGTNDMQVFQNAFKTVYVWGGGKVIIGGYGKVYLWKPNNTQQAVIIGTNTVLEGVDHTDNIRIDPSSMPSTPAGLPSAQGGGLINGNPVTGDRAGQDITLNADGFTYTGSSTYFTHNVWYKNVSIFCNPGATVANTNHCDGLTMYMNYAGGMIDCRAHGLPNNGLAIIGGNDNSIIRCTGDSNGFGSTGFAKNGLSTTGITMLVGGNTEMQNLAISTQRLYIEDFRGSFNHDEAIQFANCKGIVINGATGQGNLDKFIEGDVAYSTSSTASGLGLEEIPNSGLITGIVYDGLYSDGSTLGTHGITINCGNDGKFTISDVYIRNVVGAASDSVIGIGFASGGCIAVHDVIFDKCGTGANAAFIFVQADIVHVHDVINRAPVVVVGSGNSVVVNASNCTEAVIHDIDSDAGPDGVVAVHGPANSLLCEIHHANIRGCTYSPITIGYAGAITDISVHNCRTLGVNSAAHLDGGFIQYVNASMTVTRQRIYKNLCRWAAPAEYAICENGGIALPNNCIADHLANDNDFNDTNLTMNFGYSCLGTPGWATKFNEYNNGIPSQTRYQGTAAPSGSGLTYGRNDVVDNTSPSASGTDHWKCTTTGTDATIGGSPTATTDGTDGIVTFSTTAGLTLGQWITIATATGGPFKVISKNVDGIHATVTPAPGNAVVTQAVAFSAPVFKAVALAA